MDTSFSPTPLSTKASPAKFFAFGATLFVAIAALMFTIVLPKTSTNDQSRAAVASNCAGTILAPAAVCGEKCLADADCGPSLKCLDVMKGTGKPADLQCKNPLQAVTAACATPVPATPGTSPVVTKPPITTGPLASAPPGCTYQNVQCIQAPCNPILVCPATPTPVPTKVPITTLPTPPAGCTYQQVQCIQAPCDPILVCSSHVVKFVFRSTAAGQNMAIDYIKDGATIVDDNSALLTYTGTWIKGYDSTPYGGAYTATSTNGSAISYSTKSPSIIVRPFRYSTRGVLDVFVDGVLKRSITDLATGSGWTDISIVVTP